MTQTESASYLASLAIEEGMDYVDGDFLAALMQYVPGAPTVVGATFAALHSADDRHTYGQPEAKDGHTPIYLHRFITGDVEGHGRFALDVFVAPGLARIPDEDEWPLLAVQEVRPPNPYTYHRVLREWNVEGTL